MDLFGPDASLSPVPVDLPEVWKCAVPVEEHNNSWVSRQTEQFVRTLDNSRMPFFLYVSFPDPHHPFSPPAPFCDSYHPEGVPMPKVIAGELDKMPSYLRSHGRDEWMEQAFSDYAAPPTGSIEQGMLIRTDNISEATMRLAIAHTYGMVEMIDHCIGQMLAAIRECGLSNTTHILFTSDHGELPGDHGLLRKGPPPFEQLVRVLLIMSGLGDWSRDALYGEFPREHRN